MSDYPMLISNKLHSFRNFSYALLMFMYNNPLYSIVKTGEYE